MQTLDQLVQFLEDDTGFKLTGEFYVDGQQEFGLFPNLMVTDQLVTIIIRDPGDRPPVAALIRKAQRPADNPSPATYAMPEVVADDPAMRNHGPSRTRASCPKRGQYRIRPEPVRL
jgi:hypothetical protein